MKVVNDEKLIMEAINRRVENIFPSKEAVLEMFSKGNSLKFYYGIDPTGKDLHIGHTVQLLLLKQLYEFGHKIIILIGDFTARVGDPTGKDTTRIPLTEEQIKENEKDYLNQISKILPRDYFEIKHNSDWLEKMSFGEILRLASRATVQQMLARDMFENRIGTWKWKCPNCGNVSNSPIQFKTKSAYGTATLKDNKYQCPHCQKIMNLDKDAIFMPSEAGPIGMNEILYPLMQGYDSVAMEVDGEVGGNDQMFNMLVGRDLVKEYLKKEKIVLATKLLVNTATGKKISKTEGGFIAINDDPQEIRRKVLDLDDKTVQTIFELCTEKEQSWIEEISKEEPRKQKEMLADELIRMYQGDEAVGLARKPQKYKLERGKTSLARVISEFLNTTMSAAKDLIDQGAVRINDEVAKNWHKEIKVDDEIKVGKGKFIKIV